MKKSIFSLVLSLVLAASLCACSAAPAPAQPSAAPAAAPGQAGKRASVIRTTQSNMPDMDPASGSDNAAMIILANVYEPLITLDYDGAFKPVLATEWSGNEAGTEWTFTLRQGVTFHDGSPFTADDVVYSFERFKTIGEGYSYLFSKVDACVKVDDYTVKFMLNEPFGPILNIIPQFYIVSGKTVAANTAAGSYGDNGDYGKAWLVTHDAGSGPYMVREFKAEDRVNCARYENYWGGWEGEFADAPQEIAVIGSCEASTVLAQMTNGEVQLSDPWQSIEAIETLDEQPGIDISTILNSDVQTMMMNTQLAPTDDVHFRRAIAHVIDYATLAGNIFAGSSPAVSPFSSLLAGYTEDITTYDFNLEAAKQELAQSKYADSVGDYTLSMVYATETPAQEKTALLIQAGAAQVGIHIEITGTPWLTMMDQASSPESTPNLFITGLRGEYKEIGSNLYSNFHSANQGTWQNTSWIQDPALDGMINEALATTDYDARMAKYADIQKYLSDACVSVGLYQVGQMIAYVDYIYYPVRERALQGLSTTFMQGWDTYFRDFKVL